MSTQENFLEKVWDIVKNIFSKSTNVIQDIAGIANNFVNALKAAEASPTGQAIESIIELVIPSSTGLINALKLAFPKVQEQLANIESGKTEAEIEQLFLQWLQGLKVADPVLYAGTLTTLNAWVQTFLANNQGQDLPVENALTNGVVLHKAALDGIGDDGPPGRTNPPPPAH